MALSSGLSRLCNTKVQLHRSDFWLPSRTQNQLHPDPPHALPWTGGMTPTVLEPLKQLGCSCSFTNPRESWLCPHRDQLPVLHTPPGSNTL